MARDGERYSLAETECLSLSFLLLLLLHCSPFVMELQQLLLLFSGLELLITGLVSIMDIALLNCGLACIALLIVEPRSLISRPELFMSGLALISGPELLVGGPELLVGGAVLLIGGQELLMTGLACIIFFIGRSKVLMRVSDSFTLVLLYTVLSTMGPDSTVLELASFDVRLWTF